MGYIVLILLIALAGWMLYRSANRFGLSSKDVILALGIKMVFAGIFYFISAHHYGAGKLTGDAENFYNDSKVLADFGKEHPTEYLGLLFGIGADDPAIVEDGIGKAQIWDYGKTEDSINDNRFIIRLHSIIHFISFGNVYVHLFFMVILSLMGLLLLFRAFKERIPNPRLFFFAIICFPSIAFWGSGISKESIMIFGLGLYLYIFLKLLQERSLKGLAILILAILILLFNKPYVGLILIPVSLIACVGPYVQWRKIYLYFFAGLIILFGVVMSYTPKTYNLVDRISYKQQDLINISKGGVFFITDSSFCAFDYELLSNFQIKDSTAKVLQETNGEYKLFGQEDFKEFKIQASETLYDLYLVQAPSNSFVDVEPVGGSGSQLLINTPTALLNTLIRPFPGDVKNPLSYFVILQNFLLLSFIFFVFMKKRSVEGKNAYLVFLLLVSAVVMLLLIGWTTPILGAIFRYKVAAELLILTGLFVWLSPLKRKKE